MNVRQAETNTISSSFAEDSEYLTARRQWVQRISSLATRCHIVLQIQQTGIALFDSLMPSIRLPLSAGYLALWVCMRMATKMNGGPQLEVDDNFHRVRLENLGVLESSLVMQLHSKGIEPQALSRIETAVFNTRLCTAPDEVIQRAAADSMAVYTKVPTTDFNASAVAAACLMKEIPQLDLNAAATALGEPVDESEVLACTRLLADN